MEGVAGVKLRLGWLDEQTLACWLSSANAVLFNYRAILVSGAATLARSRGVPILLPARLTTVDLDEPHPLVFRFQGFQEDFQYQLASALKIGSNPALAKEWQRAHAWPHLARLTCNVYAEALAMGA